MNPQRPLARASAIAPATCGELLQCTLDGVDFLVTAPIDLHARATVTLEPAEAGVWCAAPDAHEKALRGVRTVLERLDMPMGAVYEPAAAIPRGKGLASSSADVTAAVHATAEACGVPLTPDEISAIAISIEPSDGVFFHGVVAYAHLEGRLLEPFGTPPPLKFVVVDTGGAVETVGLDRTKARAVSRKNEAMLRDAMQKIRRGFRERRPDLIAEGATLSARNHQEVLPKEPLDDLLAATIEAGALGVNVAHSGTVIGVMFDPRVTPEEAIVRRVESVAGAKAILGCWSLVSGGSRLLRSSRRNVSDAQLPFLELFGDPVHRIASGDGCVLEFRRRNGKRFFVDAAGRLSLEPPDPSEGLARPDGMPRPGEVWEMRVRIVSGDGDHVRYRLLEPAKEDERAAIRLLPARIFDGAFRARDGVGVRRVRVVEADPGRVVYERADGVPGQERTEAEMAVFVSNFHRWSD